MLHQDPPELAETVSQAFLGMSINCAKCHNHPLEKWTNDQYYGMANLFARVRVEGRRCAATATASSSPRPTASWCSRAPASRSRRARSTASRWRSTIRADRRVHLADWLTSPENPYFSRAITNRVWANFFGVGLVENVDDLRLTNPASNEELLDAAAKYLVDNKFDLKALMRAILQSATYQRSSQPLPENEADDRGSTRATIRGG